MNQQPAYEVILALYDAISHQLWGMAAVVEKGEMDRAGELLALREANKKLREQVARSAWTALRPVQDQERG